MLDLPVVFERDLCRQNAQSRLKTQPTDKILAIFNIDLCKQKAQSRLKIQPRGYFRIQAPWRDGDSDLTQLAKEPPIPLPPQGASVELSSHNFQRCIHWGLFARPFARVKVLCPTQLLKYILARQSLWCIL